MSKRTLKEAGMNNSNETFTEMENPKKRVKIASSSSTNTDFATSCVSSTNINNPHHFFKTDKDNQQCSLIYDTLLSLTTSKSSILFDMMISNDVLKIIAYQATGKILSCDICKKAEILTLADGTSSIYFNSDNYNSYQCNSCKKCICHECYEYRCGDWLSESCVDLEYTYGYRTCFKCSKTYCNGCNQFGLCSMVDCESRMVYQCVNCLPIVQCSLCNCDVCEKCINCSQRCTGCDQKFCTECSYDAFGIFKCSNENCSSLNHLYCLECCGKYREVSGCDDELWYCHT